VLTAQDREPGEVTTQDIFQVSPDGAYLAYSVGSWIHLRAADGTERLIESYSGLMRFSPDAHYFAAVVGNSELRVIDLATGTARDLVAGSYITQFEWVREAVVAKTPEALVELPLVGAPTTLLDHPDLDKFVAAGTGTRVVAFLREPGATRIVALDAGARHDLGVVHSSVTNAAATLDGKRVAFSTYDAVFAIEGDAAPRAIAPEANVHSLWFARDGRLGYASASAATIGTQRFTEGPIQMLRFDPLSASVLVATGDTIGLDRFAGGYVVWNVR
jgi:hypothetical protein